MGVFHIEDDWYIFPDELSWVLAREKPSKKNGRFAEHTFHPSPERALIFYAEKKRREAVMRADDGDIHALVDILSSENKRLADVLNPVLSAIAEVGGET